MVQITRLNIDIVYDYSLFIYKFIDCDSNRLAKQWTSSYQPVNNFTFMLRRAWKHGRKPRPSWRKMWVLVCPLSCVRCEEIVEFRPLQRSTSVSCGLTRCFQEDVSYFFLEFQYFRKFCSYFVHPSHRIPSCWSSTLLLWFLQLKFTWFLFFLLYV